MVGNDCCKPSCSKHRSTAEGVKDIPGLINEARVALTDGRQQGHLSVSGPAGSLLTGGSGKHMVTDPRKEEHYSRGAYTQVLMHMIPDSIGVCDWIDSRDEVSVILPHVFFVVVFLPVRISEQERLICDEVLLYSYDLELTFFFKLP